MVIYRLVSKVPEKNDGNGVKRKSGKRIKQNNSPKPQSLLEPWRMAGPLTNRKLQSANVCGEEDLASQSLKYPKWK